MYNVGTNPTRSRFYIITISVYIANIRILVPGLQVQADNKNKERFEVLPAGEEWTMLCSKNNRFSPQTVSFLFCIFHLWSIRIERNIYGSPHRLVVEKLL